MSTSYEPEIFTTATAPSNDTSRPPRTLVVVAHPDDEAIAIGARMSRFRDAHFLHVTDGAPVNGQDANANGFPSVDAYRDARTHELRNALRAGGIEHPHLHTLDIADQQASRNLPAITRSIAALLADLTPQAILTHPFEGGHPDHDACAFAVHHAIDLHNNKLHNNKAATRPVILEGAFYHATPYGSEAATFIPIPGAAPERAFALTPEELTHKREILACFVSQRQTLKNFPLEHERFRLAPHYDFTQAPHPYGFLYDRFPWGTTSQQFLELAAAAHAELLRETSPCPKPS